ncbi:hypothetical protein [Carboxylicivirga sp. N1Y90]|uniref:hypothetical protein n=1 Tax=Carboxylicivirga fragile TaxID=3417571 RepID=UPI003D3462C7|nr:hypothetical protein [Marinilabiliaceae bacterium N1Y90]
MNLLKSVLIASVCIAIFASCSKDDTIDNKSRVEVAIKTSTAKQLKSTATDDLVIEKFEINIAEIEFDIDDDMEDLLPAGDTLFTDVELDGPFLIDLMSSDAATGIKLAIANVPNAVYEEIEFDFDIYEEDDTKDIYGHSIFATGTYSNTPFVIISDEEWEIELEYPNGYKLDGAESKLWIDLNLDLFKQQVAAIDFTQAEITDGTIIISKDSNKEILNAFEKALENAFEVEEEGEDED